MSLIARRLAVLALVAAPLLASACAPQTVIRRSAFIPGVSAPARSGGELEDGQVRLSGHINAIRTNSDVVHLDDLFTLPGDPGAFIPDFQLGASAYFGLGSGFELGGQVGYASLSWSHRNTPGVLSFPSGNQEDLLLGGVGVRYNFPIKHPSLRLGALCELNFVNIPEAIFKLDSATDEYEFQRVDHENFMLPNLALQLGWEQLFEAGGVTPYLLLGVQRSVTNVGFDNQIANLDDNTLEGYWIGYAGLGAELRIQSFVIGASFYVPFQSANRIEFGPAFAINIGGIID